MYAMLVVRSTKRQAYPTVPAERTNYTIWISGWTLSKGFLLASPETWISSKPLLTG
jgi:hypothetical protein